MTLQKVQNDSNNTLKDISSTLSSLSDRVNKLEENNPNNQSNQPKLTTSTYKKPYNPWFTKMQPKYSLLESYFDISRGQLYRNILLELENTYKVDTQQVQANYCYENNIESCYPLDPFEFNPKYRTMIETIVNNSLIKLNIATSDDIIASNQHITIFNS